MDRKSDGAAISTGNGLAGPLDSTGSNGVRTMSHPIPRFGSPVGIPGQGWPFLVKGAPFPLELLPGGTAMQSGAWTGIRAGVYIRFILVVRAGPLSRDR